jgi:hypothetical protein
MQACSLIMQCHDMHAMVARRTDGYQPECCRCASDGVLIGNASTMLQDDAAGGTVPKGVP